MDILFEGEEVDAVAFHGVVLEVLHAERQLGDADFLAAPLFCDLMDFAPGGIEQAFAFREGARAVGFFFRAACDLFGEFLGVSWSDLLVQVIGLSVVALVCARAARPFLLLCFDPDLADTMGYGSRRHHRLMLALVAGTVVVSFQAVGSLLVFGMLLAPAGTAALLTRRIGSMMAVAAAFGVLSTYGGLSLSYHFDLAAGASVVLSSVVLFFVVLAARSVGRPSATGVGHV